MYFTRRRTQGGLRVRENEDFTSQLKIARELLNTKREHERPLTKLGLGRVYLFESIFSSLFLPRVFLAQWEWRRWST